MSALGICYGFAALVMDLTPPKDEHHNLLTLFNDTSPQKSQMKRLDILSDNYFYVAAHGVGDSVNGINFVADQRSGRDSGLSIEDLAEVIGREKLARGLAKEMPIFLMACNAGTGENSFAKRLSDRLGVKVIAPEGYLVVDQFGISRTGKNILTAYFNYGNRSFRTLEPNL